MSECGCPPGECRDPAADPDRWVLRQYFKAAGIHVCQGPAPTLDTPDEEPQLPR